MKIINEKFNSPFTSYTNTRVELNIWLDDDKFVSNFKYNTPTSIKEVKLETKYYNNLHEINSVYIDTFYIHCSNSEAPSTVLNDLLLNFSGTPIDPTNNHLIRGKSTHKLLSVKHVSPYPIINVEDVNKRVSELDEEFNTYINKENIKNNENKNLVK